MSLENFKRVYENDAFYIEVEISTVPWLKVVSKAKEKELSQMSHEKRHQLYDMANAIENRMIAFYSPKKVNIASFGNYLPEVHLHVMARFENDAFFPEPMWGERQREDLDCKGDFEAFLETVVECMGFFDK
jgi:diadenosine tetraphosphate (Ap4A) HIT family hydrolase